MPSIEELKKRKAELESEHTRLARANGSYKESFYNPVTDKRYVDQVDNSGKMEKVWDQIEEVNKEIEKEVELQEKAELRRLAEERESQRRQEYAKRWEKGGDLYEQAEKEREQERKEREEQRKRDQEDKDYHYRQVKKRYQSASPFTRMVRRIKGEGLHKEKDYTLEELEFLDGYDKQKPEFLKEREERLKENDRKAGLSFAEQNKKASERRWNDFARAVASKSRRRQEMEEAEERRQRRY